jgi:putative two-component system response regulator
MSSHRPYRPSLGVEPALAEIESKAGTLYDVDVARACLRLFHKEGFKFEAREEGIVGAG